MRRCMRSASDSAHIGRAARLLSPALLASLSSLACVAFPALLGASLCACSGAVAPVGDGPGDGGSRGDDGGSHDAGGDGPTQVQDAPPGDAPGDDGACPATAPALGTACQVESLQCEYGASFYPGCDTIVQCSGGTWQHSLIADNCPGPNAASCPATMAAAAGQICQPDTSGPRSCFYPTGGCYCGTLGGPIPENPDGSVPATMWQCDGVQPPCEYPRPRLGAPCGQAGLSCGYLECDFAQTCEDGVWTGQEEGCAAAGAGALP
jgi:hypothetical protein